LTRSSQYSKYPTKTPFTNTDLTSYPKTPCIVGYIRISVGKVTIRILRTN